MRKILTYLIVFSLCLVAGVFSGSYRFLDPVRAR